MDTIGIMLTFSGFYLHDQVDKQNARASMYPSLAVSPGDFPLKVGFYIQGYESIGVEYLSAVLRMDGHDTRAYFDPRLWRNDMVYNERLGAVFNIEGVLIDQILQDDLDLLCFSVVTDNFATAKRVATVIKEVSNVPIVFGGIHCTSVPERVAASPAIDYVVVGEGEFALRELCEAIADGNRNPDIPNVWSKGTDGEPVERLARPTIEDLDSLPFPDKDFFYAAVPDFHKENYITVASRGCIYSCTFCNNSMYKRMYNKAGKGKWHRRRSVDSIIEELKIAQEKHHFERVSFWDEIFIDNKEWLREFSEKYSLAIGKPFWCYGYARFVDEEIVELLENANCNEMNIGVQTIRPETRRIIRRGDKNEKIVNAMNLVRKSKIFLTTGNILQLPGQPIEEAFELAEFYNQYPVDLPVVGYLRYYPRTDIVQTGLDMGTITEEDVETIEEASTERPFVVAQDDDEKDYKKAHVLILLTPWAPRFLVPFLLRTKMWRFLPANALVHMTLLMLVKIRGLLTRKKHFAESYTLLRLIYVLSKYGSQKLRWKLSRRRSSIPPSKSRDLLAGAATSSEK